MALQVWGGIGFKGICAEYGHIYIYGYVGMYSVESFMVPAPLDFPWVMPAERVWDLEVHSKLDLS